MPLERLAAIPRTIPTISSFSTATPTWKLYSPTSATAPAAKSTPAAPQKHNSNEAPALTRRERRPHPPKKSIATPRPNAQNVGPYFVSRTASKLLPVYQSLTQNGGNSWVTQIRKIDGDAHTLREELVELLGTPEIQVRSVANHVFIKGQHKQAVVGYLESKGL